MEKILNKLLFIQLQATGIFTEDEIKTSEFKAKGGIIDTYSKWLKESIRILENNNYIEIEGEKCKIIQVNVDKEAVWSEWERKKEEWLKDINMKAGSVGRIAIRDLMSGKQIFSQRVKITE